VGQGDIAGLPRLVEPTSIGPFSGPASIAAIPCICQASNEPGLCNVLPVIHNWKFANSTKVTTVIYQNDTPAITYTFKPAESTLMMLVKL